MNSYTCMYLKIKFCMEGKNMKVMIKYMKFNSQNYSSSPFVTLMPHVQIHCLKFWSNYFLNLQSLQWHEATNLYNHGEDHILNLVV
jgi:hypothetical protein